MCRRVSAIPYEFRLLDYPLASGDNTLGVEQELLSVAAAQEFGTHLLWRPPCRLDNMLRIFLQVGKRIMHAVHTGLCAWTIPSQHTR